MFSLSFFNVDSSDMTIGVTDVNKSTTETLIGHRAPVLGVALDPKLEYLVSTLDFRFILYSRYNLLYVYT